MDINQINIFDFDGTLVNTPCKPIDWKGGWWGKKESLLLHGEKAPTFVESLPVVDRERSERARQGKLFSFREK